MEEQDNDKKIDETTKILYNTFYIIAVVFFIWLLIVIFTAEDNEIKILDAINDNDKSEQASSK